MSEREPTIADVLAAIEALEARLLTARADLMARIDRLQNALTLSRDEQIVDSSAILLMRRQIQHLTDRVQALEERRP
jgi:hypothetical protein